MTSYRALRGMAAALVVPSLVSASAQCQTRDMRGARPLAVVVHVPRVRVAGDTVSISYVVEDSRSGDESLWTFVVAAPSPVAAIATPSVRVSAGPGWQASTRYRRRSVAVWHISADSSDMVHPGQSSPPLTFSALGLPDTVWYWATPDIVAHPPLDEDPPPGQKIDMLHSYADSGITVGVSPVSDRSPAALLARVTRLLSYACGSRAWISSAGVCGSLHQKLKAAWSSSARGDVNAARGQVHAFSDELEAQHGTGPGKHISNEGYALLAANVAAMVSALR